MQLDQPLAILGGLTANTFMQEYWQRKPLLLKNAFPNFECPLTPNELAGLSLEEEIESRLIIEHGNTPWELRYGPFDEETFLQLPEDRWTLLIQAVDQFIPEVAELYKPFAFIPKWRFDDIMISYAAPGGSVGPHYDYYDVFLIQGLGKRRWKIGPKENSQSTRLDHPQLRLLADFKQTDEWVLEPGDMLYLPPQIAHYGIAEDECMTISVGLKAPSAQEMLIHYTDFLSEKIPEELYYSDPDQVAINDQSHYIAPSALTRVKQLFQETLKDDKLLLTWFGQYITEPRYPELVSSAPIDQETLTIVLRDHAIIKQNPSAKLAWTTTETDTILFACGFTYSFNKDYSELITLICEADHLDQTNLQPWLTKAGVLPLLTELLSQGILEFFDE